MDGNDVSADQVIAELIDMGFEFSKVREAIEAVGPCLDDAVEFILNGSRDRVISQNGNHGRMSSAFGCSTSQTHSLSQGDMSCHSRSRMKQSSIADHLPSFGRPKRSNPCCSSDASFSDLESSKTRHLGNLKVSPVCVNHQLESSSDLSQQDLHTSVHPAKLEVSLQAIENSRSQQFSQLRSSHREEVELDWEEKVGAILQKHFGFSSLKAFQKEALEAWLANRDCLVLAATGSGKSLCFQIPALMTGKIVVVISPLISLMHDQCLKLAKHGVSACFLGSGQPDRSIECKAMSGMYRIIYVCPETILRLVEPLKRLAETHGIALFAIDEVHCVSKWGHDFRPDYRRLSVLRENFRACNLKFLKSDIPLMSLTATATVPVREDIVRSLHMSKETKIVLTSFFRPNLRFSVKHSRTSCVSSYDKDFHELIDTYTRARMVDKKGSNHISDDTEDDSDTPCRSFDGSVSDADEKSLCDFNQFEDGHNDETDNEVNSANENSAVSSKDNQMTVEYLEDELDVHQSVDDLDVSCGEFPGHSSTERVEFCGASETIQPAFETEGRLRVPQGTLEQGPTIIYVPTRKETLKLAQFLCRFGVRAAAYHAKLPKTHLRRVHEEFHQNCLQVVVATIAFGMGIDKANVRSVIHYGWPQSLEAYYQEAGRAGRDGKLSDCTLYANLSRIPTLLPSQRSEEQTKQAYKMLSDCFRYGMSTATCRAKTLVKYFGEEFSYERCLVCDICAAGPPKTQNLKEEADIFLRVLVAHYGRTNFGTAFHSGAMHSESSSRKLVEKPNFKMVVSRIRVQFQKFSASDLLWWRGLARILEDKGFVREGDDLTRVSIKYPEPTDLGLRFLHSESEQSLYAYPEADMLLSTQQPKPNSSFSEWGRGWADPEIRRQRLQGKKCRTRKRKRQFRQHRQDPSTVRGRLAAKLSNRKR